MTTDRPTPSVTGQDGWEWNRWQASKASRSPRSDDREGRTYEQREHERQRSYREQVTALRREVRELEAELERKDRRFRQVTARYERLLAEKDRPATPRTDGPGLGGDRGGLTGGLRRVVIRLRDRIPTR